MCNPIFYTMFKYVYLLAFLCLGALHVSAQETIDQQFARILKDKRDSIRDNTNLIRKSTMYRSGAASDSFAKAIYDSLLRSAVGVNGSRLADSMDSVRTWVEDNFVSFGDDPLLKADSDLYLSVWTGAETYFRKDSATALKALVNSKVAISDTAAMLAAYARLEALTDTAAAIRAAMPSVAGKVNYTDTAAMLSPYVRLAKLADSMTAIRILLGLKVNYTDTASMLAAYVRGFRLTDTSVNLRALINARVRFTDTAGMLAPYVLGNRLTDTATALRALSNARVKYTDTAGMLSGYVLANRFTDSIALTVKKRDSLVLYSTPKNVKDSAVSVRAAIPTNNNQLTNGAGYITSTGVVYTTSVQTISNKRIQFRVTGGSTFTTSVAIDKDNTDVWVDSLQGGALLFAAPSGTPVDMDLLQIWVKDNNTTPKALTYNAIFAAGDGESLPAITTLNKWLVMLFQWNARSNKWYLLTSKIFAP